MTGVVTALAALSLLDLLAIVLSFTALGQVRSVARVARNGGSSAPPETDGGLQELRHGLEGLAAQLHDLQQSPPQTIIAAPARGGLNLAKRSHALRLHRHGNTSAEIAATLDIPLQEVELLLKIHRIVVSGL